MSLAKIYQTPLEAVGAYVIYIISLEVRRLRKDMVLTCKIILGLGYRCLCIVQVTFFYVHQLC